VKLPLHTGEATKEAVQKHTLWRSLAWKQPQHNTGIRATGMRQAESDSGKWQTVSEGFRMHLHGIPLTCSKMLRVIRNNNVRMQKN